jgi:hypothetical protein
MRESRSYGSVRGARDETRVPTATAAMLQCMSLQLCRFSDAGMTKLSRAPTAGVRKAPRHEIAGGGALTVQRALWGFCRGLGLEKTGPERLR